MTSSNSSSSRSTQAIFSSISAAKKLTQEEGIELFKQLRTKEAGLLQEILASARAVVEILSLRTRFEEDPKRASTKLSELNHASTNEEIEEKLIKFYAFCDILSARFGSVEDASLAKFEDLMPQLVESGIGSGGVAAITSALTKQLITATAAASELRSIFTTLVPGSQTPEKVVSYLGITRPEFMFEPTFKALTARIKVLVKILIFANIKDLSELEGLAEVVQKLKSKKAESDKLRNKIVEANLALSASRANRFKNRGVSYEDLLQEAVFGLIKAVDKFNPDRGVKFSTHAVWWIDQILHRFTENRGNLVRCPAHILAKSNKIKSARAAFLKECGREPTCEDLVKLTGLTVEDILNGAETVRDRATRREKPMPLGGVGSRLSEECSGASMVEFVSPDPGAVELFHALSNASDTPESEAAAQQIREAVIAALNTLPPRTQMILRLRFGIGEGLLAESTLATIGDKLPVKVTRERVRQIQESALNKLRENKRLQEI